LKERISRPPSLIDKAMRAWSKPAEGDGDVPARILRTVELPNQHALLVLQ
jgi:hypothetical protein